jgi:hypothetical protein
MVLVREVSGPDKVVAGTQATYTATHFNVENPPPEEVNKINWVIKAGDDAVAQFNEVGGTLVFDVPPDLLGQTIRVMPFRNSPSAAVSVMSRVIGESEVNPAAANVVVLSRSDWHANPAHPPLGNNVARSKRREVFIHHTDIVDDDATKNEFEDLAEVKSRMRGLQITRPDLGLDVPYNFVAFCMSNGDLVLGEGRGLDRSGAHTIGHNHSAIAISFEGDFEHLSLPSNFDAQVTAVGGWLRARREQDGFVNLGVDRPLGREVFGHRDVKSTDCPGQKLFDRLGLVRFL